MIQVDNAIIMAAGTSSRFAPLSFEKPKALITVKGEVLIERQIKQLKEAGIGQIIIVTGYKAEQFTYLKDKYNVILIHNDDYLSRNNNGSIWRVKKYLKNSYVCSADNYFKENPFKSEVEDSYYAAVYSDGRTNEWCLETDKMGNILNVTVGGENAWYMMGHTFWSEKFSSKFLQILDEIYENTETRDMLWEKIYVRHIEKLKMKIKKYPDNAIFEFDTLDELREFDSEYIENTGSAILKSLAEYFQTREREFTNIQAYKDANNAAAGFTFKLKGNFYKYSYENCETTAI